MNDFHIADVLEFGWHKTREHSALLFQILLTAFGLQVIVEVVKRVLGGTLTGAIAGIVLWGLAIMLGAGITSVLLKLVHGHPARYKDLFLSKGLVWKYFVVCVVAALPGLGCAVIAAIGVVLVIISQIHHFVDAAVIGGILIAVGGAGAVFFAVRLAFSKFAVIEGAEILDSVKKSYKMTQGHGWHLLILLMAIIGMNIIGAILFVVGLLVTIPVSALAFTRTYQKLKHRA